MAEDNSQNVEGSDAFNDFINGLDMHDELDDLQGIAGQLDIDPAVAAVVNASILSVRKTIEQVYQSGNHPIDELTDLMQYIIYAIARIVEEMTDNTSNIVLYTALMMQAVVADIEEKGAEDQTFDWIGRIAVCHLPDCAYDELYEHQSFSSDFPIKLIVVSTEQINHCVEQNLLTERLTEVIKPVLVSAQAQDIDYIVIQL